MHQFHLFESGDLYVHYCDPEDGGFDKDNLQGEERERAIERLQKVINASKISNLAAYDMAWITDPRGFVGFLLEAVDYSGRRYIDRQFITDAIAYWNRRKSPL